MEKLWMCRICLIEDVQMHLISETQLQTIYEALTCRPFETEDNRPIFTCYICHAQLQNAYQLKLRCLQSEKVFTQMLISKTITPENRPITKRLEIVHPVIHLDLPGNNEGENYIPDLSVDVKIEHENPEDIEDITIEENRLRTDSWKKEHNFDIDLTAQINSVSREHSPNKTDLYNGLVIVEENENLVENNVKTDAVIEKDSEITDKYFVIDPTVEGSSVTPEISTKRTGLNNDLRNVEGNMDVELNTADNYVETDAFIENDLIIVEQNADIDFNLKENGIETYAAIEKDSEITDVTLEKGIQEQEEANCIRTGLTLEGNGLRTHITKQDNCKRTNINVDQSNIRTVITQSSNKFILCPKELRVVLERITLTNIKDVSIQEKLSSTMENENKENTKTKRKQTKINAKMTTKNDIKSITKNKKNNTEKQILKRVSFRDTDKENTRILNIEPCLKPKKDKPFTCDICKKCFTVKDTLRIHIRTHTQEKAFKCDKCVKSFHYRSAFVMHYRTHTGDKPFRCDVCQKRFHRKVCLDRHSVIHFGLKPFKCLECGRGFNFPHNLNQHKLTHSGERPNKCTVCGKGFIEKRSLIMHSRIHTDEKPYKCDICKKYFHCSEKLLNHFKIHSENSPFKCEVCKAHFICEKNFKKHVIRKHERKPRKKY